MTPSRRRALLSVHDKSGVEELGRRLADLGFEILSTGGTARVLGLAGVPVTPVEDVTGFPEMLDGRVKTLHPSIHGAILYRRDQPAHVDEAERHGLVPIDLVVVNLYPFREALGRPEASPAELLELIDVGGPTLVRAAAKNHAAVTVLVDPADYASTLDEFSRTGSTTPATRRRLAARAFEHCSAYDAAIAAWLSGNAGSDATFPATLRLAFERVATLRYGENPHQRAALYSDPSPGPGSLLRATLLQGGELSYNNYLDLDAAWALAGELEPPAAVIVKHNNPCGVALGPDLASAYRAARAGDPTAAFGGVVALNRTVDADTGRELASTFLEAVIAPGYTAEARAALEAKRRLRLLETAGAARPPVAASGMLRSISGGVLVQDVDSDVGAEPWRVVTRRPPTAAEERALRFAWTVARHVRSNAIVYATEDRTLGIGAGQMSRVDAARFGALKAVAPLAGSVLASDGFFPFRDGVDAATAHGVRAIVQPGGSVRDAEVIAAADEADLAMVFTGRRHFRH